MKLIMGIAAAYVLHAVSSVEAADNMKAFPSAEDGMVRHVLHLTEQDNETGFKVELVIGQTVKIDKGNQYFFGGSIEREIIQGWGFSCYKVSELGPMAGTLMAVDPDAPKVDRFITLGGEPYLIRYNSRLPVVVYAPEGVEVRYRIWNAGPDTMTMEKG